MLSADLWDSLLHKLFTGRVRAEEGAHDASEEYEEKLFEREHERSGQVDEETSLEGDRPSYDCSDHYSQNATS